MKEETEDRCALACQIANEARKCLIEAAITEFTTNKIGVAIRPDNDYGVFISVNDEEHHNVKGNTAPFFSRFLESEESKNVGVIAFLTQSNWQCTEDKVGFPAVLSMKEARFTYKENTYEHSMVQKYRELLDSQDGNQIEYGIESNGNRYAFHADSRHSEFTCHFCKEKVGQDVGIKAVTFTGNHYQNACQDCLIKFLVEGDLPDLKSDIHNTEIVSD